MAGGCGAYLQLASQIPPRSRGAGWSCWHHIGTERWGTCRDIETLGQLPPGVLMNRDTGQAMPSAPSRSDDVSSTRVTRREPVPNMMLGAIGMSTSQVRRQLPCRIDPI